jgi:hypothetical protein
VASILLSALQYALAGQGAENKDTNINCSAQVGVLFYLYVLAIYEIPFLVF